MQHYSLVGFWVPERRQSHLNFLFEIDLKTPFLIALIRFKLTFAVYPSITALAISKDTTVLRYSHVELRATPQ